MGDQPTTSVPDATISANTLAGAFPYFLVISPALDILQAGHAMSSLCNDVWPSMGLAAVFEITEPKCQPEFGEVQARQGGLFTLKHLKSGRLFRGQMLFDAKAQRLIFLGAPWLDSCEQLGALAPAPRLPESGRTEFTSRALNTANEKLDRQRAALEEAEEKLRLQGAESRKLALIAAHTDNAVVLTGPDGLIEWTNEGFSRLTGWTLAEVQGKKPGSFLQGQDTSPQTVQIIREKLRLQKGFKVELVNYSKHGRKYWIAMEIQPIRDDSGRLTNFMSIERDVTARVLAEQRRAVQYEVARCLAESETLSVGIIAVLRTIATALRWEAGVFWQLDAEGAELYLSEFWRGKPLDAEQMLALSRMPRLIKGEGLPGKVWESRHAAWSAIAGHDWPAQKRDNTITFKQGYFAIPLLVGGGLCGVLELSGCPSDELDRDLMETFDVLGQQVGQFVVRKQAEIVLRETITLHRAILQAANYSIITTTPSGRIVTFNWGAERMLGYSAEELIGKATPALLHVPEEVAARAKELSEESGETIEPGFEVFVAKAQLGLPDEREWTYVRKDGGRLPVRLSVTPLIDHRGEISGYLGIASDITEQKRAAAELLLAKETAEAANRSKSEFLASMSHELRTPLAGVLNLAEVLTEEIYGPLNEKQRRYVRTIEESGRHLLALINDILDLAKIEAGRLELDLKPCLAEEVCQSSYRLVAEGAKRKGQNLSFKVSPPGFQLIADRRHLIQILVNLLSNAIKFTPEKGRVDLGMSLDAEAQRVCIRVQDTGIGISKENLARLFQPFVQLDSRLSRQYSGTGLGLALVRKLAEQHGGSVEVESEEGAGSSFIVTLPQSEQPALPPRPAAPAPVKAAAPPPAAPISEKGRILLVEDSAVIVMAISSYLKFNGFKVEVAGNGKEGIEAAARLRPDLILMDIQMPGVNGLEAIRQIRLLPDPEAASVPIIALTALAMQPDRERCLAAGANRYLSKPVELQELLATANQLTATRKQPQPEPQTAP